jgi:hypothetical protein
MISQRTAKRLRSIARGMVVAAEEKTGNPIPKVAYTADKKTGQIRVAQGCWKGAYKALKKGLKKDHMGSAWNQKLSTVEQRKVAVA